MFYLINCFFHFGIRRCVYFLRSCSARLSVRNAVVHLAAAVMCSPIGHRDQVYYRLVEQDITLDLGMIVGPGVGV
jgi:hypothetical protein